MAARAAAGYQAATPAASCEPRCSPPAGAAAPASALNMLAFSVPAKNSWRHTQKGGVGVQGRVAGVSRLSYSSYLSRDAKGRPTGLPLLGARAGTHLICA
jgi:hypothetical protein